MIELLEHCTICPRNCGINRTKGEIGFCKATDKVRIARAALHHWEEPCISGTAGSGTVFFSHCNLKCVFCQNYDISQENKGFEVSIKKLSEIFLSLQNQGAHNINLVTPTHYIPQIIEALIKAKAEGLKIPIVYNSSGYEKVSSLKLLKGYIDIYLPDLKYFNSKFSARYSKATDYFEIASDAIKEMVSQVGNCIFDKDGIMQKGVIIRHLMLPGLLFDSKKVVDYIYNTYGRKVYISLMNQYTPLKQVQEIPELNRQLNQDHYDSLIEYALSIGVRNAYIQEGETAKESFIPNWGTVQE